MVTFTLTRLTYTTVAAHVKKNAGILLPPLNIPWIYLSNFYSSGNSGNGNATRLLQSTLKSLNGPYILCCEPLLGTDPRSLTPKNCDWTPDQRYTSLCNYYNHKFHLLQEIPIDCTLKTELTGIGQRWSYADRKFMWGVQNFEYDDDGQKMKRLLLRQ